MSVRAGIVITGTEVLDGRVRDRNGPWLADRLRELGVDLAYLTIVGDRPRDMERALRVHGRAGDRPGADQWRSGTNGGRSHGQGRRPLSGPRAGIGRSAGATYRNDRPAAARALAEPRSRSDQGGHAQAGDGAGRCDGPGARRDRARAGGAAKRARRWSDSGRAARAAARAAADVERGDRDAGAARCDRGRDRL